ncbi:DUF559 domain-containing protein [Aeromicrobium sp.]|uniref:DUF559 domain-containing protein n=1 Tax=Aeromicrobium sp. TaxID=1871063 RepID=UPI0025BDE6F3|nr:DUF559 domain-containing protein [Aeromicrobium sp.]MCK5890959.1 DUF559 domain-containing protein [Aeromicrobium sp.]
MDPSRPFTTRQAEQAGIGRGELRGPRFRQLVRGVHIAADATLDLGIWISAALLLLPPDAVVSHTTAMRLHGFDPPGRHGLEFSTNTRLRCRVPGVVLHRRKAPLRSIEVAGVRATGPERTFVDLAVRLNLPTLVALGDHLVHRGLTRIEELVWYAESHHTDGVRRSRRVLRLVREGAESPRETWLRLMLRFARLPEPEVNADIHDELGRFLARGDLVFRRWKVLVEYDGRHHAFDTTTWHRDLRRREQLEAEGWIVIVVTHEDLRLPATVPTRVYRALAARGYAGPAPVMSAEWRRWFTA